MQNPLEAALLDLAEIAPNLNPIEVPDALANNSSEDDVLIFDSLTSSLTNNDNFDFSKSAVLKIDDDSE